MSLHRLVTCVVLGALFSLAVGTARAAPPTPPTLAWAPPADARVGRLDAPRGSALRVVDPSRPITLGPGEALFFPVGPGDVLGVEGAGLAVGLGSGTEALPDAVTFFPEEKETRQEHRVPAWSGARLGVVRAIGSDRVVVRVLLGAELARPMPSYRADQEVFRWTDGGAKPSFGPELGELQAEVRYLDAARWALGALARTRAGRFWLRATWLERTARLRRMTVPFSPTSDLELRGGKTLTPQEIEKLALGASQEHRRVVAGETVIARADAASAITVLLRFTPGVASMARVYEGETLLQVIEVDEGSGAPLTYPRLVRLVPSPGLVLRVEVQAGQAVLSFRGYRRLRTLFGGESDRGALLRQSQKLAPQSPSGRVLSALSAFSLARTQALADRLVALARADTIPKGLRALSLAEVARHPPAAEASGLRWLREAWEKTEALPPPVGLSLRRSVLVAAVTRRAMLPPGALRVRAPVSSETGALAEDRAVVTALSELISPPVDGARPEISARLDRLHAASPERDDLAAVARWSWLRSAVLTLAEPLDASGIVAKPRPIAGKRPTDLCRVTPADPTELLIGSSPVTVKVAAGPGTHARGLVERADPGPTVESWLDVDDVPVPVHGGAGLRSLIAVAPGRHTLRARGGPAVLVDLPVTGELACSRLRAIERWVRVERSARFLLPAPGAPSVVSVVADPDSVGKTALHLGLSLGGSRAQGLILPGASGALELPVPAAATELLVEVDRPVLLRVHLRLHQRPVGARVVRPSRPEPPPAFEEGLVRVREATRNLRRATSDAGRRALRLERARALTAIGYARLGALDRERAGAPAEIDEKPSGGLPYLDLPVPSPEVVPLGHVTKIPPLPLPPERGALERALRERAQGKGDESVLTTLSASARAASGADALLLADLAESLGNLRLAAEAYERIGEAHHAAEALARAASLYADLAAETGDETLAQRAHLRARDAELGGAVVGATLGRLDRAIAWQRAEVDAAAGEAFVERARVAEELTPSERVRAALLDAPALVPVFGGPELTLGLTRIEDPFLQVTSVCHAIEGPEEPCAHAIRIDERPVTCDPTAPAEGVARPTRCRVAVPPGARRLTVRAPEGRDSIGFVDVRRVAQGDALPLTQLGRWYETSSEQPVRLTLLGPTVVRVSTRAYQGEPGSAWLAIERPGGAGPTKKLELALSPNLDRFAQRSDSGARVTGETEAYVTVPLEGPAELVVSSQGRALVQIDRAVVVGVPRPRGQPDEEPAPLTAPVAVSEPSEPIPEVGRDPAPWPLTLRAYASAVSADLAETDTDPQSLYAEVGLGAARALLDQTLWLESGVFGRLRSGPKSYGLTAILSLRAAWPWPGAYLRGEYLLQPYDRRTAAGGLLSAGIFELWPVQDDIWVSPQAGVVIRDPDRRFRGEDRVDHVIYTRYADLTPWSLDLALYLYQRLAIDALLRYGASTRFVSGLRGVDRHDGSVRFRVVSDRAIAASFEIEARASHRPAGPIRDRPFTRLEISPGIVLFQWFSPGRLTAALDTRYSRDFPASAGRGSAVAAGLTLSGELGPGRGLADVPSSETPFRERLEEGANLPERAPLKTDPIWAEP